MARISQSTYGWFRRVASWSTGASVAKVGLSLKPQHLKLSPHTSRHTHGYHIIQAGGHLGDVAEGLESRLDQVFGGICQAGSGRKRGAT